MGALCYLLCFYAGAILASARQPDGSEHLLDARFNAWLPTFKAADPQHQAFCMNVLTSRTGSTSELEQDVFVFFNAFKYWPMMQKKGFYLDSGANDAVTYSNTFFFDKCLGWEGICVEPQEQYHTKIRQQRSCTLVTECISATASTVSFSGNGPSGGVIHAGGQTIKCSPLAEILKRSKDTTRTHIDFWSLDVEGYELTVLGGVDFSAISVHVMLIEDYWVSLRQLDIFMTGHNFQKYQQLAVDCMYVNRSFHASPHVWYPPAFNKNLKRFDDWRVTPEVAAKIKS